MKISINVIGLGFVGLTTALGFSEKKFDTVFVENNKNISPHNVLIVFPIFFFFKLSMKLLYGGLEKR